MKTVVMGAGAIGGFYAGMWSAAGLDVTLLGRTRQVADYAQGVRVFDGEGWQATGTPEFTADPAALATADLIVLTVKCTALDAAIPQIAEHARPGTVLLSFQNGVSAAQVLAAGLPDLDVVPGMVRHNVVPDGPGAWRKSSLGHAFARRHPMLEAVAAATADGPAPLELVADMEPILWGKLLLNLNNALNALSGVSLRDELYQRPFRRVYAAALRETLELLEMANIRPATVGALAPHRMPLYLSLPNFLFRPIAEKRQKLSPDARTSMAEDFAQGRASEIEWLNGAVVDLAQRYGVEAPVNARIVELVRDAEAGGKRQWTGRELARAVLGRAPSAAAKG